MAPPNDDNTAVETVPTNGTDGEIPGEKVTAATAESSPTEMIYYTYDGCFELECEAQIMTCQFIDGGGESTPSSNNNNDNTGNIEFSLNRTVLHAQGGGQPTDIGVVEIEKHTADEDSLISSPARIEITKVVLDRSTGIANHKGRLVVIGDNNTTPSINVNQLIGRPVRVTVDKKNRKILSECHTAGHVVDAAMARCEKTLPALKGYHFLDGPYVEYKGSIPPEERDELLKRLQQAFVELVDEDIPTKIDNLSRVDAQCLCDRVAENYFDLEQQFPDEQKDVRIVTVAGWPCPCGGTHVRSTGALRERQWGITGFRSKKGVVRVKYNMDWNKDAK